MGKFFEELEANCIDKSCGVNTCFETMENLLDLMVGKIHLLIPTGSTPLYFYRQHSGALIYRLENRCGYVELCDAFNKTIHGTGKTANLDHLLDWGLETIKAHFDKLIAQTPIEGTFSARTFLTTIYQELCYYAENTRHED